MNEIEDLQEWFEYYDLVDGELTEESVAEWLGLRSPKKKTNS